MSIRRVIHRENPYVASRQADAAQRRATTRDPERTAFFAEREVQNADGSFPFGEGFLYADGPARRSPQWAEGTGAPARVFVGGHQGAKWEQQDAFGAFKATIDGHRVGCVTVSDGVSASGRLAKRASNTAVSVFQERLQALLSEGLPENESARHVFVEQAMVQAATAANFEVVRQVLFDRTGGAGFDQSDRRKLEREEGVDLTTRKRLSPQEMQILAPQLEGAIAKLDEDERSSLATFAVAVAVDNDLYTFSSGDAVVGMFRPTENEGERFIHLTHRDQSVVELFREGGRADLEGNADVYENIITDSFGGSAELSGTLRRYPNLLEPGDRIVASSDGLGPRGGTKGLDRTEIEAILVDGGNRNVARELARAQVADVEPGEYQDNIGIAVLNIGE